MSNNGTLQVAVNRTPNTTLPLTVPAGKFWYIHPKAKGMGTWNVDGAYVDGDIFLPEGKVVNLICGATDLDYCSMTYIEFDTLISYQDVPVNLTRRR